MKRSIVIGAVIVAAIASPVLAFPFYDRIVPLLGPVLSRHEGIPRTASAHYSLKEGLYWTWKRPAKYGCLSWMAMEKWASVQVLVDRPCETVRETSSYGAKGLSTASFEDHLVFQGYWPWSSDVYDKLIVYDNRGMVQNTLPCPYSLTRIAIAEMRFTTAGALSNPLTEAEKRVVAHILERLTHVDGKALSSLQHGCSDWNDEQKGHQRVDPWSVD